MKRASAALAAVAVAAVAAVAATADDQSPTEPPSADARQVTAVQSDAKQAMAVLDRERASVDAMPSNVAAQIDSRPSFGANPSLSRLAVGNASNSVYVVPADGHVCAALTVGDGANLNCPTTGEIAAGRSGPATVVLETGDVAVYGLVPDGVGSVSVETGAGASAVEVVGNAYYTVVPSGTRMGRVDYVGPAGDEVSFELVSPLSD